MATGIRTRHGRGCAITTTSRCTCTPSFEAFVFLAREGTKIRKTFAAKEAKAWRAAATTALSRGQLKTPVRRTLREEVEDWLAKAQRGEVTTRGGRPFKPGVIREYERSLRLHVLDDLGGLRVSEVRRQDVQALVDRMRTKRSGGTTRNMIVALQAVFRRVLENDELAVNPTANLRLPAGAGTRERVVGAEEAGRLIAALPIDDQALWGCAGYAGLRRGELRGLKCDDLDLAGGIIHVRRGWDEKDGEILPKSAKGARQVPIAPLLRDLLVEHVMRTGRRGEAFVFGSTATTPFTPTAVRSRVLKAWKHANSEETERAEVESREPRLLDPVGLHELRHSFVSMMHDAGFSLEEIGDYIGHSSTYMTDRYRHLLPGATTAAAERFGEYLARANTNDRLVKLV